MVLGVSYIVDSCDNVRLIGNSASFGHGQRLERGLWDYSHQLAATRHLHIILTVGETSDVRRLIFVTNSL